MPVNTDVYSLDTDTVHRFHCTAEGKPQFCYYSHVLRSGGLFAAQLTQQVLAELIDSNLFTGADQRALTVLCKELSWKKHDGRNAVMMQRASVFPGFYGRLAIALGGGQYPYNPGGSDPPQTRVGRGAEALNSPIKKPTGLPCARRSVCVPCR